MARVRKIDRRYGRDYTKRVDYYERIATKQVSKVFKEFAERIERNVRFSKVSEISDKIGWQWFEDRMKITLQISAKRTTEGFVNWLNTKYKSNRDVLDIVKNEAITRYANNLDMLVKGLTETTKDRLDKIIEEGLKEGLKRDEIKNNILSKIDDMSKGRAKTIATTETWKATSLSNEEMAVENGMEYKQWLHTHAGQTARDEHKAIDGTKIKMNETFNVNGFEADCPHDPSLPASEVINCHCIVVYS